MTDKYDHLTDPGIRAFLIAGEALYPSDAVNFTMNEQRAFYDKYCQHFQKPLPPTITVENFQVGAVSCRRYLPETNLGSPVLYLHGGGYVVGSLESHHDICGELAEQTGSIVTAVNYRLAPEHPFPAAFDDCWQVLQTMPPCVVAGDSAGGNLSAALCLKARDLHDTRIKGQVLIYPGLGGDLTKGSYILQANAPGLSTADVINYRDTYQGRGHVYAEPLATKNFRNLPQAFLVACGHDPLHDDCANYAAKLEAAGVAAEVRDEPELVHAFLRARHMSIPAAKSFAAIVAAIKQFAA